LGTPDANGKAANANGFVLLNSIPGDVRIRASITDVRKQTDLSDYTGQLKLLAVLQVTDTNNSSGYSDAPSPATMPVNNIQAVMPCTPTASTSVGSTCAVDTTENAILPGAVLAGARAIWEIKDLFVLDGGPDGSGNTNTVFLDAGVFVP
jgi:hypothetical protein